MTLVWRPGFEQWDPSLITTTLWLDAADASTVTTVSGVVSEWRDKSGNNRHATQNTAGVQPVYNTNKIVFDTNDLLVISSPLGTLSQNGFLLAAVASSTSASSSLLGQDDADRTWWRVRGANQTRDSTGAAAPYSTTFGVSDSNLHILSSIQANNFLGCRRDGSAVVTLNTVLTTFQYLTNSVKVGRRSSEDLNYGNKEIHEIICISALSSLGILEKIEGYLAHKWGLTANLPSNHPYKTNAPAP